MSTLLCKFHNDLFGGKSKQVTFLNFYPRNKNIMYLRWTNTITYSSLISQSFINTVAQFFLLFSPNKFTVHDSGVWSKCDSFSKPYLFVFQLNFSPTFLPVFHFGSFQKERKMWRLKGKSPFSLMKQREHLMEVRGRREEKKHIRTQEDRWIGEDKVKNYKSPGN